MTQPRYYAGIGSRATPHDILDEMRLLANALANTGFILRSGHADGADMAFENAARDAGSKMEIFLPWDGFNGAYADTYKGFYALNDPRAYEIARHVHPAWERCSRGAKALHARNVHQIHGIDLQTDVEFVVCWTKDGKDVGGTRTAIMLARDANIPVYNLAIEGQLKLLINNHLSHQPR